MECHGGTVRRPGDGAVALVGNHNVGKSMLFSRLTGRYVAVSNYPGTTVELTRGSMADGTELVDTPGLNALSGPSEDEAVTRRVLLDPAVAAVVQVADAKNLRRALPLTLELLDLGVPVVLAMNMMDEAEALGVAVDAEGLSRPLGIPVVPTVATRGTGVEDLVEALGTAGPASAATTFPRPVEEAVATVGAVLPDDLDRRRARALLLLGGPDDAGVSLNGAGPAVAAAREDLTRALGMPVGSALAMERFRIAGDLVDGVLHQHPRAGRGGSRLSRFTTHPVGGWLVVAAVLFLLYELVGVFAAGTMVGWIENTLFGEWINPWATRAVTTAVPWEPARDLLVGPYGVITMSLTYAFAIVLPIVAAFFIAFSILEDSGYLPRLSIMLNRAFNAIGLNGKAVLPMVLGLGCDTMATMTTRVLETRRERIQVTLLLALGVPCSAQLGVLLGMLGILSPVGVLVWGAVVLATMLTVGWLAARLLPGRRSDFIVEVPPLRLPRPGNILMKTLSRVEWYLREVVPLFILGTLVLFSLDLTGLLPVIERAASPVVEGWLGLPAAVTGAFLIGFLRRDYGAAGIFALAVQGKLDGVQVLVSLVAITLFVPCIANLLIIVKEFGGRVAAGVAAVVFPLAFLVAGLVNVVLRATGATV